MIDGTDQTVNVCSEQNRGVVICFCGMTGCGKSTIAKKVAKKYNLRYISGGDVLKALALEVGYKTSKIGWWETDEGMKFFQQRMTNPTFDKKADERLMEMAKKGNIVLDSWTMPWLLKKGFKIWFEASPHARARRVAKRDGIDVEMALRILREKDRRARLLYKSLYGFELGNDFSPFKLILATDELDVPEVFQAVCLVVESIVLGIPPLQASLKKRHTKIN